MRRHTSILMCIVPRGARAQDMPDRDAVRASGQALNNLLRELP